MIPWGFCGCKGQWKCVPESFDIRFWVFVDRYYQSFVSEGEAGRMFLYQILGFLYFPIS